MVQHLRYWLISVCTILSIGLQAQDIELYNPSWEDYPHQGIDRSAIIGWNDCGFAKETPPDIHMGSDTAGFFDVRQFAADGLTYLGMVVRSNETWESVSQLLPKSLIRGRCYSFSLHLAMSSVYNSRLRGDSSPNVSFTHPAVLRIYGSNARCGRTELLAMTEPIKNTEWETYEFKFEPKATYRYIIFEAFYKTPAAILYNGNILLDNASAIRMIDCNDDSLIAQVDPSEEPKINQKPIRKASPKPSSKPRVDKPINTPREKPKSEDTKPKDDRPIERAAIIPELEKTVEVDQIIKIEHLYFDENLAKIKDISYDALNEVYDFLRDNRRVSIEVSGHTNGLCNMDYCDKLSRRRARSVWMYLVHKGISPKRLKYKGYGKQKPIADNDTLIGRQKNQRVEIKILSVNG